jgi:hypothetical protein
VLRFVFGGIEIGEQVGERTLHVNHAFEPRAALDALDGVRVRRQKLLAAQPSLAVAFKRFRRNMLESSHFFRS